jgi:hypothetical protein
VDGGVVSWKFKPMGEWPLAMITSPSDRRLIIDPSDPAQLIRGTGEVRVRVWGEGVEKVAMSIDGQPEQPLQSVDGCTKDNVTILIDQNGEYQPPPRNSVDYENTLGVWQEKHILGTQLGSNENGRHW